VILEKGKRYTTDHCDIYIHILNIPYRNTEYYKVKAKIFNKHNGIFYEQKYYKIPRHIPIQYNWKTTKLL
jgi:hypothetical protein